MGSLQGSPDAPSVVVQRPPEAVGLDLHRGICDPEGSASLGGCPRSRFEHRLIADDGRVVLVRCKATNLCPICRAIAVRETVEMLKLDAMEDAPAFYIVLTAREFLSRADTYSHLRQLRRAVRRLWPAAEWFVTVEQQKRGALHLNLLFKRVPDDALAALTDVVVGLWCSRVDALPAGQYVGRVLEHGGVIAYIDKVTKETLAHGLKSSQAMPLGWKGHRSSQTRGYFVRPVSAMRAEARLSLRYRAIMQRLIDAGEGAHDAELLARERMNTEAAMGWAFVSLSAIATESGWANLAVEMGRRDVLVDAFSWDDVDRLLSQSLGREPDAGDQELARLRAKFDA